MNVRRKTDLLVKVHKCFPALVVLMLLLAMSGTGNMENTIHVNRGLYYPLCAQTNPKPIVSEFNACKTIAEAIEVYKPGGVYEVDSGFEAYQCSKNN